MIRVLPIIAGIIPVAGVALAYWLNVDAGTLPACVPFLDGCVSISATGRYSPGDRAFRAVLLPLATALVFIWWFAAAYLATFNTRINIRRSILFFGVTGAIALVIYVSYLASNHPFYEFMRRFGIYFYFLGTALAQLIFTLALKRHRLRAAMLWIIGLPFLLGILNLILKLILEDTDSIENQIEWVSALLMQTWFVLLYFEWRRSQFRVTFRTD